MKKAPWKINPTPKDLPEPYKSKAINVLTKHYLGQGYVKRDIKYNIDHITITKGNTFTDNNAAYWTNIINGYYPPTINEQLEYYFNELYEIVEQYTNHGR